MIALLLAMLAQAGSGDVHQGPHRHDWDNHFRLWSRINDDARPLSIGHELVFDESDARSLAARSVNVWSREDIATRKTSLEDIDFEVATDGTWSNTRGDEGVADWMVWDKNQVVVVEGSTARVFLRQAVGVVLVHTGAFSEYQVDYQVADGVFDLSGLLDPDLQWEFRIQVDDLGTEQKATKLVAVPWKGKELDVERPGYAFFFFTPERGTVAALGVRLRFQGEPAPGRLRTSSPFKRVPPVALVKFQPWSFEVSAEAGAQVGGLIELDRPRPGFLAGGAVRGTTGKLRLEARGHNGGGEGLIGWQARRIVRLGLRGGYFVDSTYVQLVLGLKVPLGPSRLWVLDVEQGVGSAMSTGGRLGRIVRTGRRWDLMVGVQGFALDVDWAVDKTVRFPVYGGISVGALRSGWSD